MSSRYTAARRVLIMALAALDGTLGTALGLVPTLYLAALITALTIPFVLFSSVRKD